MYGISHPSQIFFQLLPLKWDINEYSWEKKFNDYISFKEKEYEIKYGGKK